MHIEQVKNVKSENAPALVWVWVPVLWTTRKFAGDESGKTYHLKPQASEVSALNLARTAMHYHPEGVGYRCFRRAIGQ